MRDAEGLFSKGAIVSRQQNKRQTMATGQQIAGIFAGVVEKIVVEQGGVPRRPTLPLGRAGRGRKIVRRWLPQVREQAEILAKRETLIPAEYADCPQAALKATPVPLEKLRAGPLANHPQLFALKAAMDLWDTTPGLGAPTPARQRTRRLLGLDGRGAER